MNISRLYKLENSLTIKKFEGSEQNILSSFSILKWANKRGFSDFVSIKETHYGKPYIKVDKDKYIFYENVEGKKLKLNDKEQVISSIKCLGRFHLAGEGYVMPSGIKTSAHWGRCMEKYKTFTCKLEEYADAIERRKCKNEFEEKTLPYLDNLYKRAKKSVDFFRSEKYINAIEKSMKKREICVNDFTQNSVILVGEDKRPVLTKIFSLGYNMCEEDIACMLRRYIEENKSIEFLEEIINEYGEIRSIDEVSRECIRHLSLFPETPIKIISKYMKKGLYRDDMLEKFINISEVFKNINMEV